MKMLQEQTIKFKCHCSGSLNSQSLTFVEKWWKISRVLKDENKDLFMMKVADMELCQAISFSEDIA